MAEDILHSSLQDFKTPELVPPHPHSLQSEQPKPFSQPAGPIYLPRISQKQRLRLLYRKLPLPLLALPNHRTNPELWILVFGLSHHSHLLLGLEPHELLPRPPPPLRDHLAISIQSNLSPVPLPPSPPHQSPYLEASIVPNYSTL